LATNISQFSEQSTGIPLLGTNSQEVMGKGDGRLSFFEGGVMTLKRGPHAAGGNSHPAKEDLQRFMAGGLIPEEVRAVVLHLLRGCPACSRETRRIWRFGEEQLQPAAGHGQTLPAREVGVWQ
jgi:hypothetical protein